MVDSWKRKALSDQFTCRARDQVAPWKLVRCPTFAWRFGFGLRLILITELLGEAEMRTLNWGLLAAWNRLDVLNKSDFGSIDSSLDPKTGRIKVILSSSTSLKAWQAQTEARWPRPRFCPLCWHAPFPVELSTSIWPLWSSFEWDSRSLGEAQEGWISHGWRQRAACDMENSRQTST